MRVGMLAAFVRACTKVRIRARRCVHVCVRVGGHVKVCLRA